MKLRVDTIFYRIGQFIWIPFIIIGLWFNHHGYDKYHQLLECSLRKITGFPCPGCGGTRAFCYLFSGEFIKSFLYHPVVIYGICAYLHFMGLYFYRHHFNRNDKNEKEIQIPIYIYIAIAVILIQWLAKILRILL